MSATAHPYQGAYLGDACPCCGKQARVKVGGRWYCERDAAGLRAVSARWPSLFEPAVAG